MLDNIFGLRNWATLLNKGIHKDVINKDVKASDVVMPELPYKSNALDPVLSSTFIEAHLRIHKKYVDKTRELVDGTDFASMSLDEVVKASYKKDIAVFNNAGQAWNHAFFWMSISPPGQDTAPTGNLLSAINKEFETVDNCRHRLIQEANKLFGSGWLWVVRDGDTPAIITTKNADNPLTKNLVPILCLDLWEHSYFGDYEDDRMSYIDSAVKDLFNWGFADKNWDAISGSN